MLVFVSNLWVKWHVLLHKFKELQILWILIGYYKVSKAFINISYMWLYNTCLTHICLQNCHQMNWKCFLKTSTPWFSFQYSTLTFRTWHQQRNVFNVLKFLTIPRLCHTSMPYPFCLKLSSTCIHLANVYSSFKIQFKCSCIYKAFPNPMPHPTVIFLL